VRFGEVVLQAGAAAQAIQVLCEARETVDCIFVRIASSRRTVAEPLAARLVEVLLEPREGSLVVSDGLGYLLLRWLEELVFEEECPRFSWQIGARASRRRDWRRRHRSRR